MRVTRWFILILILPTLAWGSAYDLAITQAKLEMSLGHRKESIAELTKAQQLAKKKKEAVDVARKRRLFAEQFLTAQSFQQYQAAKAFLDLSRYPECLQEYDAIPPSDQDNLFVLRVRGSCLRLSGRGAEAEKSFRQALEFVPGDVESGFGLAEVLLERSQFSDALEIAQKLAPSKTDDIEELAILRARGLTGLGKGLEAIDALKRDQETHLDHIRVLYELGMAYSSVPAGDWMARRYLSLFISRCKHFTGDELKTRGMDSNCQKAQTALVDVNKRLKVGSG